MEWDGMGGWRGGGHAAIHARCCTYVLRLRAALHAREGATARFGQGQLAALAK